MEKINIINKFQAVKQTGKPVIGCFPLYPPLELFHAMGFAPVVLWGFKGIVRQTPESDNHIQPYACSVARHLTEFLLTEGKDLMDGIFMYNACDTLRNLPEIFIQEFSASSRNIPVFRMHIPMAPQEQTDSRQYLTYEISALIHSLETQFDMSFSEDRFAQSVQLYNQMRSLSCRAEQKVAEGGLSFLSFVRAMQGNMFLPVEDQIGVLDRLIGRENRFSSGSTQNQGINSVIVSGILPPPESVISAMDGAGLRVAGNDIALLRRSYENIHEGPSDPAGYYEKFYLNHYPCPTLLYTGDQRLEKLLALIGQSGAKGVVLVGEKFCEYEYFEFPYIEKKLKEKGIHSILIEISIEDESHTSAHTARIEAFAEMIKN